MNDQAIQTDFKEPKSDQQHSLRLAGWTIRILTLAALVVGGFTLAFFLFQDVTGQTTPIIEEVAEPIEISRVESSVPEPVDVPLTSITSCISQELIDEAEHPLTPLIDMAEYGRDLINQNVEDYTAILTKRVRSRGKLQPEEKLFIKIRHARGGDNKASSVPFSVYTRFENVKKGQEVIYVDGQNDNKLVAHGPVGLLNLMTVRLDPEGRMAMNGNRYPIWTIGMLNLIELMIEKAENDLKYGDCQVLLTRNVKFGDTLCTKLVILHEEKADHFEFHRAEIYIDDDRNLPIGFRSYGWPEGPDGRPRLQERYYYTDIELNVGLNDADFDPANPEYNYPGN